MLKRFSSLSESGFIPTIMSTRIINLTPHAGSHLFQRVASFLPFRILPNPCLVFTLVLISFREWLHSYDIEQSRKEVVPQGGSHLFQRVASFLLRNEIRGPGGKFAWFSSLSESGFIPTRFLGFRLRPETQVVLISFREWLHSYI